MIRITINGPIAVGKTTVGDIIELALMTAGYSVERLLQKAHHRPGSSYLDIQMEETNEPFNR